MATSEVLKQYDDIDQLGIVCADTETAKTAMRAIFGVEPDGESDMMHAGAILRGEKADCGFHRIVYNCFNIEIEFMTPLDGDSTLREFLDQGRFGLHHVRFAVSDYDEARSLMVDRGIGVAEEGDSTSGGGVKYIYFDTADTDQLSFFVEAFNAKQFRK